MLLSGKACPICLECFQVGDKVGGVAVLLLQAGLLSVLAESEYGR